LAAQAGLDLSDAFRRALAALDSGDVVGLRDMLAASPELVRARAEVEDGFTEHDEGYFHRATLLHHVAGNPNRCPMPGNAMELARVLLDAGAEVDATCGGGPSQPQSAGGTTLGLVMSSAAAVQSGQAGPLIDLLLERGARAGVEDGGLLWLALYHTVECRRQLEAAEHLRERGAAVDLCLAAGLGELGTVKGYFLPDGSLSGDAAALWRPRRRNGPEPQGEDVLAEALACACANGREQVASFLLDHGARADAWTRYGPHVVTPLHVAAWAGWPGTCRLLLERGADPALRDPRYHGTPLAWAAYCGRRDCVAVFANRPERLDLLDAVEHCAFEVVKPRLDAVDPDSGVGRGRPGVLLRLASWHGRHEFVRYLLGRGADPSLPSEEGRTALDHARQRGHAAVVAMLEGGIAR
jgi:ankyrin repeat protein